MLSRARGAAARSRLSVRAGVMLAAATAALGGAIGIGARAIATPRTDTHKTAKLGDIAELTTRLNDLAATLHVTECDSIELEKIGKDFSRPYALRTLTLLYKQPDKLRLDGSSPVFGGAVLILNGTMRYYSVPRLHLRNREDLKETPVKRQSLLEYGGLIAPETLTFMQARFVQQETVDDQDTQVYDLTYRGGASNSHYRIWIDPKTHITLKRAWYDSEKKLKATFYYQVPKEVSQGIWLPTRIEVKNAEGSTAAVTQLEDVQIDQGIKDSLFEIDK